MTLRAVTWNLAHGRDFPPDPTLFTSRSRLFRVTERNQSHVQLNRDLFDSFVEVLAAAEWDVALLQEAPPRWARRLARACGAEGHRVLTSRNWVLPLTSALAAWNPDLIASWEGGSNLTLVRGERITERRTLVLRPFLPERRALAFTRLASGICVANLHASTRDELAEHELRLAASTCAEWAAGQPLLMGGDFNLRPQDSIVFDELREAGFTEPTGPDVIDHLLGRGISTEEPPRQWLPDERELTWEGLRLRPSDHAPVSANFAARGASRLPGDEIVTPAESPNRS